jgi:hypothetical protein
LLNFIIFLDGSFKKEKNLDLFFTMPYEPGDLNKIAPPLGLISTKLIFKLRGIYFKNVAFPNLNLADVDEIITPPIFKLATPVT